MVDSWIRLYGGELIFDMMIFLAHLALYNYWFRIIKEPSNDVIYFLRTYSVIEVLIPSNHNQQHQHHHCQHHH